MLEQLLAVKKKWANNPPGFYDELRVFILTNNDGGWNILYTTEAQTAWTGALRKEYTL